MTNEGSSPLNESRQFTDGLDAKMTFLRRLNRPGRRALRRTMWRARMTRQSLAGCAVWGAGPAVQLGRRPPRHVDDAVGFNPHGGNQPARALDVGSPVDRAQRRNGPCRIASRAEWYSSRRRPDACVSFYVVVAGRLDPCCTRLWTCAGVSATRRPTRPRSCRGRQMRLTQLLVPSRVKGDFFAQGRAAQPGNGRPMVWSNAGIIVATSGN